MMKVTYGNGTTEYGPGVSIELDGSEIARAIDAYIVAHGVCVRGARTIRIRGDLIGYGSVYVDPSGFVIRNGKRWSGRGPESDGRETRDRRTFDADLVIDGKVVKEKIWKVRTKFFQNESLKMGYNTMRLLYLKMRGTRLQGAPMREMFENIRLRVNGRLYEFHYPPRNRVWPSRYLSEVTNEPA